MQQDRLNKIIAFFWKSKGNDDIFFLGRCADVSIALQRFLNGGQIYLVGAIPNSNIAWHTVLKYGDLFYDIRGSNTLSQIRQRNPIVAFNDDLNTVKKASPSDLLHIKSLLNEQFVQDTVNGLRQALRMIK